MLTMSTRTRCTPLLAVVITAALVLAACGSSTPQERAAPGPAGEQAIGAVTTDAYLDEVQPQLQAYGVEVDGLVLEPPHDDRQGQLLQIASARLDAIAGKLDAVEPEAGREDAHAELVAAVEEASAVAGSLATAARIGDGEEFERLVSGEWMPAQSRLADAIDAATRPAAT